MKANRCSTRAVYKTKILLDYPVFELSFQNKWCKPFSSSRNHCPYSSRSHKTGLPPEISDSNVGKLKKVFRSPASLEFFSGALLVFVFMEAIWFAYSEHVLVHFSSRSVQAQAAGGASLVLVGSVWFLFD